MFRRSTLGNGINDELQGPVMQKLICIATLVPEIPKNITSPSSSLEVPSSPLFSEPPSFFDRLCFFDFFPCLLLLDFRFSFRRSASSPSCRLADRSEGLLSLAFWTSSTSNTARIKAKTWRCRILNEWNSICTHQRDGLRSLAIPGALPSVVFHKDFRVLMVVVSRRRVYFGISKKDLVNR